MEGRRKGWVGRKEGRGCVSVCERRKINERVEDEELVIMKRERG